MRNENAMICGCWNFHPNEVIIFNQIVKNLRKFGLEDRCGDFPTSCAGTNELHMFDYVSLGTGCFCWGFTNSVTRRGFVGNISDSAYRKEMFNGVRE